jgi:hypothetical protein
MFLLFPKPYLNLQNTKLKTRHYKYWQIAASKQKEEVSIETLRKKWDPNFYVFEQMNPEQGSNMS